MNTNPFHYLDNNNTGVPTNSTAWQGFLGICNDYYALIVTISIVACLLTVIFVLIKMAIYKRANKKGELKDVLTTKVVLMFIISMTPTILTTAVKIAQRF